MSVAHYEKAVDVGSLNNGCVMAEFKSMLFITCDFLINWTDECCSPCPVSCKLVVSWFSRVMITVKAKISFFPLILTPKSMLVVLLFMLSSHLEAQ